MTPMRGVSAAERAFAPLLCSLAVTVAAAARQHLMAQARADTAATGAPAASAEMPAWVRDYMERLTADGGRWITSNSAYRGENEPWDEYGMEWTWGIGRQSLVGRLFGRTGGREGPTFWEFRTVWHPGEGRLLAQQFGGDGTFAPGTLTQGDSGSVEVDQTFFGPDGSSRRIGHVEVLVGDELRTQSFDWQGGAWQKRRYYVWWRAR